MQFQEHTPHPCIATPTQHIPVSHVTCKSSTSSFLSVSSLPSNSIAYGKYTYTTIAHGVDSTYSVALNIIFLSIFFIIIITRCQIHTEGHILCIFFCKPTQRERNDHVCKCNTYFLIVVLSRLGSVWSHVNLTLLCCKAVVKKLEKQKTNIHVCTRTCMHIYPRVHVHIPYMYMYIYMYSLYAHAQPKELTLMACNSLGNSLLPWQLPLYQRSSYPQVRT